MLQVVLGILAEQTGAITIRHLFYLVVSAGAIDKTERGYQNLKHQLAKWRRAGAIDWTAFSDSTRWYYGRPGHAGPRAFLEETIKTYRYNLWQDQDVFVEIWAEKDAIASILLEAADPWRVQVFPCRGFASLDGKLEIHWDRPPSPAWPQADVAHYQAITFPEIVRAVATLTGQRVLGVLA